MGDRRPGWLQYLDHFGRPPERVVSLVPSVTESLCDLNLGEKVVGVTDYCVHPEAMVAALPKVGGTKNPRLDQILALRPDLVIANREENTKSAVTALETAGIPVWVTFPKTVEDAIALLRKLAGLFQNQLALQQVELLEVALEWAEAAAADLEPTAYFCPIWQEHGRDGETWWMTFNRDTYCHDLLARLGGRNIFADRRQNPSINAGMASQTGGLPMEADGEGQSMDIRYPRVSPAEVVSGRPELILLPDEPFSFNEGHIAAFNQLLEGSPAVENQRVRLVEGSLLTWHGTRLARALQTLPQLLAG